MYIIKIYLSGFNPEIQPSLPLEKQRCLGYNYYSMSVGLSKYQKQELGKSLAESGYTPADFVYEDKRGTGSKPSAVSLICRNSPDYFRIWRAAANNRYFMSYSIPGTGQEHQVSSSVVWSDILSRLGEWASALKRENDAVDPWAQEAESMANDDSYFTVDELPRVDRAIQKSLEDLKQKAIDHGKKAEQIEDQLAEIKLLLQKTARTSTKREWMSIFKGIILEKLVDWGMGTALFQGVLHTLIASAQDITQLAEHASRHLP